MKPFNLEEAKKGASLISTDGISCKLVYSSEKEVDFPHLIVLDNNISESASWITDNGKSHSFDVFMAPTKHTGYQILYKGMFGYHTDGHIYDSEEEAKANIQGCRFVSIIKIEYEI